MADTQMPSSRGATPSMVPMKRTLEDDHTPSVSSPLNPDATSKSRPRPVAREQREKKDSLKKRESAAATSAGSTRGNTPQEASKKQTAAVQHDDSDAPSPIRYNHPLPRDPFHYAVRDPVFVSHEPEPIFTHAGTELKRSLDHPENKKHYRYTHCVADPSFSFMRYYRCTDDKPYGPRMSFADSDKMMRFDDSAKILTNEKGWRMARANVCAREGSFYYEVKILRGVPAEGSPVPPSHSPSQGPLAHIRLGWSRREAPLDVPVGFDGYSYGLTDIRLEPMHKSRMSKYLDQDATNSTTDAKTSTSAVPSSKKSKSKSKSKLTGHGLFSANDHAREGDVIGLEISLPSLSLHRKVVDGSYNPAVDVTSGLEAPVLSASTPIFEPSDASPNIVRDRFPVPYKGSVYFESMEYRASKAMEAYGDRGPHSKETPSPNHPDPTVRSLPHSHIKVYKNGKLIGTAFRNLMAFLPPSSQNGPEKERGSGHAGGGAGGSGGSTRREVDDGLLGYFPTVAAFHGGIAELNFGPDFWFPPPGLETSSSPSTLTVDNSARSDPPVLAPVPSDADIIMQDGDTDISATNVTAVAGKDDTNAEAAPPSATEESITSEEAAMRGIDAPRTKLRPIAERYTEQIAEDILYDIIDEVDFFMQDGGDITLE